MDGNNCEKMLLAKMAEIDGEDTEISPEHLHLHFTVCESCRQESEQLQAAVNLLKRQTRREQAADLWPAIEKQIGARTNSRISWKPYILLGLLLVIYKLVELLSEKDPGLAFKVVPLIFIVGLFVFLKENPFKINAELTLER